MKKILFTIIGVITGVITLLSSCSRADHLKNYNNTSSDVSFNGTTGNYNASLSTFYDTLKVSKNVTYSKSITLNNTEGIKDVVISNGINTVNGSLNNKIIDFSIPTKGLDNTNEDLVITINYINGNTKKMYVKLYTFINLTPVANMVFDVSTKTLDFSSSYDLDARFGGKITEYQVTINGVLRKRNEVPNFLMNEINSIVSGKSYNVKLDVFDNDGVSNSIEKSINL